MSTCPICGKPSGLTKAEAQRRSDADTSHPGAAHYLALFTTHAACQIASNKAAVLALMASAHKGKVI
jgi:hypothetical protein